MHIRRLVGTTTFRLAIGFMLAFSGVCALALGLFHSVTMGHLNEQVQKGTGTLMQNLLQHQDRHGLDHITEVLDERLRLTNSNYYGLFRPDGQIIVGNVSKVPDGVVKGTPFTFTPTPNSEVKASGRFAVLPGGYQLLVGIDISDVDDLSRFSRRVLLTTLALILSIGIIGGVLLTTNLTRRIDAITTTSNQIMSGDLAKRIRGQAVTMRSHT